MFFLDAAQGKAKCGGMSSSLYCTLWTGSQSCVRMSAGDDRGEELQCGLLEQVGNFDLLMRGRFYTKRACGEVCLPMLRHEGPARFLCLSHGRQAGIIEVNCGLPFLAAADITKLVENPEATDDLADFVDRWYRIGGYSRLRLNDPKRVTGICLPESDRRVLEIAALTVALFLICHERGSSLCWGQQLSSPPLGATEAAMTTAWLLLMRPPTAWR